LILFNIKIIKLFFFWFYDSEGCVARSSIISASICEKGLKEISILLRKLEIESKLCPIDNGRYYVLYIFRKQRFKRFKERIGFTIVRKNNKIDEILANNIFYKEA